MPAIQAVISTATRQRTRLDLAAKNAVDDAKLATLIYGRGVAREMSKPPDAYPAIQSKYRRTFELKRAWEHQVDSGAVVETGKGFQYEFYVDVVDTNARTKRQGYGEHYAVKVQGDGHGEGQKPIHGEHGWVLFINVLDRHKWHTEISNVIRFLKRK